MNGTQLALLYALRVSELKYCGPLDASQKIYDYLTGNGSYNEANEALQNFEGLYAYLKLIAEKNNKDPNDYEVAEAYWIGNDLLKNITEEDIKNMIKKEFSKALPPAMIKNMVATLPKGSNAQHSFHVFHVRSVAGRVPMNKQTPDECIVSWGEVQEVFPNKLIVSKRPLIIGSKGIDFGSMGDVSIGYHPNLITPKIGQTVSIHWSNAVQIITGKQFNNLRKYTIQNMVAVNSSTAHHF